ncbi:MAG TPA: ABC transporter ATP-binding protein [Chitinophagales bacterium]|nr:ABC transporter ATP-binding protein [Chitinophagales bacterium]
MKITIDNAGKRFNFEWILQHVSITFQSGKSYAILGPNGSGKSTMLQMIAGVITPSSGLIMYSNDSTKIEEEEIFRHLSFTAPYVELIEEFTAAEMISFQKEFKPLLPGVSEPDVLKIAQLENDTSKQIRNFSSGMKQRLKISLALMADVPVILLDEPTTNLDQQGFEWYLNLIKRFSNNRLLIICSNLEREYGFCDERIDVMKFKA